MRNHAFDVSFLLMSAPLDIKDARLVTPAKTNTNKTAAWSAWRAATRPSLLASVAWLVAGLPRRCTRTHTHKTLFLFLPLARSLLLFPAFFHSSHTFVCTYLCLRTRARASIRTRARTHTHTCTHTQTHANTHTDTNLYVSSPPPWKAASAAFACPAPVPAFVPEPVVVPASASARLGRHRCEPRAYSTTPCACTRARVGVLILCECMAGWWWW